MRRGQEKRTRKQKTTLADRLLHALIGLLSMGLLSVLVLVPLLAVLWRIARARDLYWLLVAVPLAVSGLTAVWGFVAPDNMRETLTDWWESVIDRYRP